MASHSTHCMHVLLSLVLFTVLLSTRLLLLDHHHHGTTTSMDPTKVTHVGDNKRGSAHSSIALLDGACRVPFTFYSSSSFRHQQQATKGLTAHPHPSQAA